MGLHFIKAHVLKAFKNIRIRKQQIKTSKADALLSTRTKLKKVEEKKPSIAIKEAIESLNVKIADILSEEGRNCSSTFKKYCNQNLQFLCNKFGK